MTKEQAVTHCKEMIKRNNNIVKEARKVGDINTIKLVADLDIDSIAIETVLNMLKEKDKEIEKLEKQNRNLDKEAQQYFETTVRQSEQFEKELEKKDKIINEMALYFNTGLSMCEDCEKCFESEDIYKFCKDCIKQYLEKKVEKEKTWKI